MIFKSGYDSFLMFGEFLDSKIDNLDGTIAISILVHKTGSLPQAN